MLGRTFTAVCSMPLGNLYSITFEARSLGMSISFGATDLSIFRLRELCGYGCHLQVGSSDFCPHLRSPKVGSRDRPMLTDGSFQLPLAYYSSHRGMYVLEAISRRLGTRSTSKVTRVYTLLPSSFSLYALSNSQAPHRRGLITRFEAYVLLDPGYDKAASHSLHTLGSDGDTGHWL